MNKVTFLLILLLSSSCTSTNYESQKIVKIFTGHTKNHTIKKSLTGVNEFYLWGLLPKSHTVYIDKKSIEIGLSEFSVHSIEEYQNFKQFLYSLLSFGMYIPRTYKVNGHGIKSGS